MSDQPKAKIRPPRPEKAPAAPVPLPDPDAPVVPPGHVACMLCERAVELCQAALASRPDEEERHVCGRCLAERAIPGRS